jgi:dipeptidase E
MRLLLGSGGYRTPERVALFRTQVQAFFGPGPEVLFVPYALEDHDAYLAKVLERGLDAGYRLVGIHHQPDPVAAVKSASALFVGGGNTFRLLDTLQRLDLIPAIRERVRADLPYLGVSAGTNVACPTIKTTNDMPIVWPASPQALGLVPFQINPHYFEGQTYVKVGETFHEHFGETRDERLQEFHERNDAPVLGLWEAGMVRVENGTARLLVAPARLFRRQQPAIDFAPEADLSFLLNGSASPERSAPDSRFSG